MKTANCIKTGLIAAFRSPKGADRESHFTRRFAETAANG